MKRILLFTVAFGLAGLGCAEQAPAPGDLTGSNPISPTPIAQDGGTCARPEEGCACAAGAGPIECFGDPVPDGDTFICNEGAMYCRDGSWSACETIRSYTLAPSAAALVDGPSACNPCNPGCSVSRDYPTTGDLTPATSTNVTYDPSAGGITLRSLGTSGGTLTDSDGDGVPDIADDYPSDPRRWIRGGGFYHTLPYGGPAVIDPLNFNVQVKTADVYFVMDTTGSMGGEIANLRSTLTSGSFIAGCGGGVIGAIRCTIPDAWFGVGEHADYPVSPYGGSIDIAYVNHLDITPSVSAAQSAVNGLRLRWGNDGPEAQLQALWSISTGGGLYRVPARRGCSGGRWGYPCFRPGTIPIVILFTDAPFHNGPSGYNYTSWLRAKTWGDAVNAMAAKRVRLITVMSDETWYWGTGRGSPLYDANVVGSASGSVDGSGRPYVFHINSDGSGLGPAVVSAVVSLANFSRFDVSARATDNPGTAFDERRFVQAIRAVSFPAGRCTGISGGTVFTQCLPGTAVNFSVTFRNNVVMPTAVPQIFNFSIQVLLNGTTVQATIPVRIVVPPVVPTFPPSGSYSRNYDATIRCTTPPDRPDWGSFTWTASTPSDSSIRFEVRTADTLAALPTAPAVNIPVPPTAPPIDLGLLLTPGAGNYHPYVQVTAVLIASSDRLSAPTLTGFELQYTCAPAE